MENQVSRRIKQKQRSLTRQSNISEDEYDRTCSLEFLETVDENIDAGETSDAEEDEPLRMAKEVKDLFGVLRQPAQNVSVTSVSDRIAKLGISIKEICETLPSRSQDAIASYESAYGEFNKISVLLKECILKMQHQHFMYGKCPPDMVELEVLSHDLEYQRRLLSKAARNNGRIEIESRMYKLIEVMLLDVRIRKARAIKSKDDLLDARKLLATHGIPFRLSNSKNSIEILNCLEINNNLTRLKDDDADIKDFGPPLDPEVLPLEHLLGSKLSHAGCVGAEIESINEKEMLTSIKSSITQKLDLAWTEFQWPWNWSETVYGVKRVFSVIVMIIGLTVFAQCVPDIAC